MQKEASREDGESTALRYCSQAQLDALAQRIELALSDWRREWGISPSEQMRVRCVNCTGSGWQVGTSWVDLGGNVWLGVPLNSAAPNAWMPTVLFGPGNHTGEIAQEVASAAWKALANGLRDVFNLLQQSNWNPKERESAPKIRPWSGAVQIAVPIDAHLTTTFVLDRTAVREMALPAVEAKPKTPAGPLVPLTEALSEQRVIIGARMQPVDISLGDLQSLQTDDVVMLSHRLDEPLLLRVDETTIGHGFPGRVGERWAVEIQKADVSALQKE